MMASKSFGAYLKECRIARGLTLRAFCQKHGFDPGNLSKLERGLFAPPESDEKLTEYALALGLRRGSDAWFEFFDRAAAERGQLPKDILSNEEVVGKLPVLFRTLRGGKVDGGSLRDLIERIRRA